MCVVCVAADVCDVKQRQLSSFMSKFTNKTHTQHKLTHMQGNKAPAHTLAELVRMLSGQETAIVGRKQKNSAVKQQNSGGGEGVLEGSAEALLKGELQCLREAVSVLKKGRRCTLCK